MLYFDELKLRNVEKEDICLFKKWYNDYEITSKASFCEYIPRSSFEENLWIEKKILDSSNRYFIIVYNKIDIGYIAYSNLDFKCGNIYLSIIIGEKDYKNKGIGVKTLFLFEDYLLKELNIRKVNVQVAADNMPSIKLFKKCNYIEQGRLIKEFYRNNEFKDIILFCKFLR